MQVFRWKLLVTGLESVNLEAEGDAFLSTFFPRSELSADAVNLRWRRSNETPGPTYILGIPPETSCLPVTCQPLCIPKQHLCLKCDFIRFFLVFRILQRLPKAMG